MNTRNPEMDERATAVDNEAARKAMDLMTWLLVIDMGVRSWWPQWVTAKGFSLDVVVVIFAGAFTRAWFNWRARTYTERRIRLKGWAILVGAILAALLVWVGSRI